jgi:hypothetical protein
MLMQHVLRARELLDGAADEVPVLRESGGRAQRPLLTAATDADRRVRLLQRLWLAARVG